MESLRLKNWISSSCAVWVFWHATLVHCYKITPLFYSKRSRLTEEDPDERRRKFLERNRAAAARCRYKRKAWINGLERKSDDLAVTNQKLASEITLLRTEIAQLKSLLLAHKSCPVTLQQQQQGQLNLGRSLRWWIQLAMGWVFAVFSSRSNCIMEC
jgi:hypothetical protein